MLQGSNAVMKYLNSHGEAPPITYYVTPTRRAMPMCLAKVCSFHRLKQLNINAVCIWYFHQCKWSC